MSVTLPQAITFNSVDLYTTYGLTLTKFNHSLIPASNISQSQVPYQSGSYPFDRWSSVRVWELNCILSQTTTALVLSNLDSILLALNETAPKVLELGPYQDRYWMAQLNGEAKLQWVGATAVELNLSFLCADPHAYSNTLSTYNKTQTTDPQTYTVTAGQAAGSVPADPIFTFNPAGNPASITVNNTTTGESCTYGTAFTSGANNRVRMHSGLFLWQTSTDAGVTWTDSMANVSGTFCRIKPGVSNSITVSGFSSGSFPIQFRARYL